jgi:hypothetical protein
MSRALGFVAALVVAWLTTMSINVNGRELSGVSKINQIMLQAHLKPGNRGTRDNLDNKVLDGKATDEEKKVLLALYAELSETTPPKGDVGAWRQRTAALRSSLQDFYDGKAGARERFTQAKDCKSCHAVFRE